MLDRLDPILRLYEGCASRTIGRPEEATIVKFHIDKPKISYLFCQDFDTNPHPEIQTTMQIDLRNLHVHYVHYYDFDKTENPPLVHQKEKLVASDYLHYEKFSKLSQQEVDWGLLDNLVAIQNKQGWLQCLSEHCATFYGYRLIRNLNSDPYKLKLLKAQVRTRQAQRASLNSL